MNIPINSWWVFVGPDGDSAGMRHKVVDVTKSWICTWSEPYANEAEVGGWSYWGPASDFLRNFKPL